MQPIGGRQEGPQQFQTLQPTCEHATRHTFTQSPIRKPTSSHALQYGVKVKSKDAKDSATCWRLYCVYERRDEVEVGQNDLQRWRTGNIKMFAAPFYPHMYCSHLESQHANSWELYKEMSTAEKALYFASKIKPFNTLRRHMELKDDTLTYANSARIVKTNFGDLFFRDDEVLADSDVKD